MGKIYDFAKCSTTKGLYNLEELPLGTFIHAIGCDYILRKATGNQWLVLEDLDQEDKHFVGKLVTFRDYRDYECAVLQMFYKGKEPASILRVFLVDQKQMNKMYPIMQRRVRK